VPRIQNISLVGNSIPKESCDSFEVNEDFVQTKSLFAMLEAIEINSLDMMQCRLLLTIFKVVMRYTRWHMSPLAPMSELLLLLVFIYVLWMQPMPAL
jgi:hypothetical protein